jgi:hypothetical protein
MLKRILLSGAALTITAGLAVAQSEMQAPAGTQNPPHASSPSATPADPAAPAATGASSEMQAPATSAEAPAAGSELLYTNMQGQDVVDSEGNSLGKLSDVVVDSTGQLNQIIIGTGGLLGLGQTLRAYDAQQLPPVVDGKVQIAGLTSDTVGTLPEYTYPETAVASGSATGTGAATTGSADTASAPAASDATTPAAEAPAGTVATGGNIPGSTQTMTDNTASAPAPAGEMATSGRSAADAVSMSTDAAVAAPGTMWPLSYLVGATINNADQSADINDLRFDGNRIAAVLVDQGALGLGSDVSEVPFENLSISGTPKEPEIALRAGTPAVPVEGAAPAP